MSLDKAIQHGKEKRRPYRGSKAVDRTCCNHGSCSWCAGARQIKNIREDERTADQIDEWFGYWGQACEMDAWSDHLAKKYEAVGLDDWKPLGPQIGTYTAIYDLH
jgi:hypothetical protein